MLQEQATRQKQIALLTEMAEQYHQDFCVVRDNVPVKPDSERKICFDQIYAAATLYGVSGETMDDIMDQAEKKYAQYFTKAA